MNSRFRNYGFWTAIISSIFMLLQALGLKINAPYINEIITAILGVLVVLGIISNPKDGTGFSDTKITHIDKTNNVDTPDDDNKMKSNKE